MDSTPVPPGTSLHAWVRADLTTRLAANGHRLVAANYTKALSDRWDNVMYAARARPNNVVSAEIVLYRRHREGGQAWIVVNHLSETEQGRGGYTEGVSPKVLDALTPTDHPEALAWRAAAQEHIAHTARIRLAEKAALHSVIELPRPLDYGPGHERVQVVYVESARLFREVRLTPTGSPLLVGPMLQAPNDWAANGFSTLAPGLATPITDVAPTTAALACLQRPAPGLLDSVEVRTARADPPTPVATPRPAFDAGI